MREEDYESAVAIIGMSGRFPGADNVEEFWKNLVGGIKSIRPLTDQELIVAQINPGLCAHPRHVKVAAPVNNIEWFDAEFFGFAPREAETMDPQHRLFLECAWEALEAAGYDPGALCGVVGVFAGSGFQTYLHNNLLTRPDLVRSVGKLQLGIGNDRDSLSSMVSYKLNLRGPSIAVQTFCSTSLVAVHLGCQSLLTYESDLVLAGGVAIEIPQTVGYVYEEGGIVAPDGECRSFDARAQGSVIGNGLGVVAMRRMSDAVRDHDHVYAVIIGSAVNNDGLYKAGYAAPGLEGQAEVITEALANASVSPESIGYIEAHGTGTLLGDSIELTAMAKVFEGSTRAPGLCVIGSVKPNVGHLDRASGVTGLIKTALMLERRLLPPNLNYESPNPTLDPETGPFSVNTTLAPWPEHPSPRRAGVSSFGLGGTNAHVVLEEAPTVWAPLPADERSCPQLLVWSAKTATALDAATENLRTHLAAHPELALADVAFTLQVSRAAFNHRRMVVCQDHADALAALDLMDARRVRSSEQSRRSRQSVLLFPGTSGHTAGVGNELYEHESIFRQAVDECAKLLDGDCPSLSSGLASIEQRVGAEIVAFVVQYALGRLLLDWGVAAELMAGEDVGALVADCLLGTLPLATALTSLTGGERESGSGISSEAVMAAVADTRRVIVDVGSGMLLRRLAAQASAAPCDEERLLSALPEERRGTEAYALRELAGRLWLAGAQISWPTLHTGRARRRVSLPTYPFERRRYWIEPQPRSGSPSLVDVGKQRDIGDWFYLPVWKQSLRLLPKLSQEIQKRAPWLVFADDEGLGDELAHQLRAADADVTVVRAGDRGSHRSPREHMIDGSRGEAYQELFATLDPQPRTIVHAWSLDQDNRERSVQKAFDRAQDRGFYSLLALTGALASRRAPDPVTVLVLTRNAVRVTGADLRCPEQATLIGACRVIPQENPHLSCRHIDVEVDALAPLARSLLVEACAESDALSVAYRSGERWQQTYEPLHLPPPQNGASRLRERGVYLITGGLGEVGLVLAEHLAVTRRARLVLVGRSAFPPRSEWDQWLATHPTDMTSRKILRVRHLEAMGAEVLAVSADVADQEQLSEVVAAAKERFGQLHGVVHGAGISDERSFGPIQALDRAICETHFRPKVHGLLALSAVLATERLDFCVTLSSLSAVLGGLGFAAYAAANSCMDAVAQYQAGVGSTGWLAVDWEAWRTRGEKHLLPGSTIAEFQMAPQEGAEAFERVLAVADLATQVVNSSGPLQARITQWVTSLGTSGRSDAFRHPRPPLSTPYSTPCGAMETKLAGIWEDVLGLRPVGVHDNFFELGGHSLLGVQLIRRISEVVRRNVPIMALVTHPTVHGLSEVINLLGEPNR